MARIKLINSPGIMVGGMTSFFVSERDSSAQLERMR